ncbi:hypothetical protein B566_EDAN001940 [Ephemera danica]|nr:hypothetical protein B566_EDAN001940 [Ephemera danica]
MVVFGSGRCRSTARLDGKTAVITGANTGIGFETARELLKRGARVVLACRNVQAALEATNKLRNEVQEAQVRVVHLDLASLTSVKECASELRQSEEKIHLLINNAGKLVIQTSLEI